MASARRTRRLYAWRQCAAASRPAHADVALLLLDGGEHKQASWARMLPAFLQWAYGRQAPAPATAR